MSQPERRQLPDSLNWQLQLLVNMDFSISDLALIIHELGLGDKGDWEST